MSSFRTESGLVFDGVSQCDLLAMRDRLEHEYGLIPAQICETAAFSHAMVIRFALGLKAADGEVCALVKDGLCGWIALAALRHLVNAGAKGNILLVGEGHGQELARQLKTLQRMGVQLDRWDAAQDSPRFAVRLLACHNVICGLYTPGCSSSELMSSVIDTLNEVKTPVHALEAPLGIDVDTGVVLHTPLYASSTLSLGAALAGLCNGRDYVGRHYLCDLSIPPELYTTQGVNWSPLFAEQPVIRIFPDGN